MKKLLTILLALLVVTGVVFAALPGNATLHLESSVAGFLKHGFFEDLASEVADFDELAASSSYTTVADPRDGIDLSGENELGYYNFWSNSKSNVVVTFTANSMKVLAAEAGADWYVPYKLSFTLEEDEDRFDGISILAAGSIGSMDIGATNATQSYSEVLFTTTGSGSGYISIKLDADFNQSNHTVLPEGTYTGTIVAAITSVD